MSYYDDELASRGIAPQDESEFGDGFGIYSDDDDDDTKTKVDEEDDLADDLLPEDPLDLIAEEEDIGGEVFGGFGEEKEAE